MVLRIWIRRVMEKKNDQVNMQKVSKLWWVSLIVKSKEAARLKVAQLKKISHVRIKNNGLVKSRASSTITGIVP